MNFPEKKFVVSFDPSQIEVDQLLKAVQDAGYTPTRHSAVGAVVEVEGAAVEAAAREAAIEPGGQGSVVVKLTPPAGQAVSDLVVEASGEGALEPGARVEGKAGEKEVVLPVSVKSGASAGPLEATLKVKYKQADQPREARLVVPVYVE